MNTNHSNLTKNTGVNVNCTICAFLIAAAVFVTGCGQKVSGIYKPVNDMSIIRALNFTSDGKVETSSALGTETDTYVVEGNQVKIKSGKDIQVFTIDKDGSLDGGTDLGRFMKQNVGGNKVGGNKPGVNKASGNKLSGIYKPVNDMSIIRALNFTSDGKVETSVSFGNETDTYVIEGNQVKIKSGNDIQVFTIGKDGSLDGGADIGRFVKQ